MAKVESKLDEIFERNNHERYDDNDNYEGQWFDMDVAKEEVKALFLEIHLAAHDEAGSEAEAMKLFEQKIKEL